MFALLRLLSMRDVTYTYSHWSIILFQFAGIVLGLSVIWFTSVALAPALRAVDVGFGESYFDYVVLGEILIFLPLALFSNMSSMMRYWISEGTMDDYLLSPRRITSSMITGACASLAKESAYLVLMFLVAKLVFGLNLSILDFLTIVAAQIFILPTSLGLGMIAATFLLVFGRGDSLVSHAVSVLTLMAGVYFPLSVFPEIAQSISHIVSPFTIFVEMGREFLNFQRVSFVSIIVLVFWSALTIWLGSFVVEIGVKRYKINGTKTQLRF